MKAATLESKFPLLAVENGCIVSKEADVTVAFREIGRASCRERVCGMV